MSWTHRCRECSLIRVKKEGAICTECQANMAKEPFSNFDVKEFKTLYDAPPGGQAPVDLSDTDKELIKYLVKKCYKNSPYTLRCNEYSMEVTRKLNAGEPL